MDNIRQIIEFVRWPVLIGVITALVLATFFVVLNLMVDVLQTTLDPRIQRS